MTKHNKPSHLGRVNGNVRFPMKNATLTLLCLLTFASTANAANLLERGERFTKLGAFQLNEATLDDVRKSLGNTPINEFGDAGGYTAEICYFIKNRKIFLVFSSGELGGTNHLILNITTGAERPKSNVQCKEIEAGTTALNGLDVGISKQKAFELLGSGKEEEPGHWVFLYEGRSRLTPAEIEKIKQVWPEIVQDPYSDVVIAVHVIVKQNIVTGYSVWRTETF